MTAWSCGFLSGSGRYMIAYTAAIAGHEFENPTLVFSEILDTVDRANIGSAVLRDYAVTFDQKNARVRFLPIARPVREPLGIQIGARAAGKGPLDVVAVTPRSLAERAGVKGGDVVLTINGKDAQELGPGALGEEFGRDRVLLQVRRGDETHEITISRE